MKLFEFDEDSGHIKMNKPWIALIPEFKAIYSRDKPNPSNGQRIKKRAIREFSFIYFMQDFGSPIRDWEPAEKRKEALAYCEMEEKDVDEVVKAAMKKYEQLILEATRSIRTYRALLKVQDAMDDYFEKVDFTEQTKTGELRHSPEKVALQIKRMDETYDAIEKFEKRVERDLSHGSTGIRGTAVKGEKEDEMMTWSESDIAAGSDKVKRGEAASPAGKNAKIREEEDGDNEEEEQEEKASKGARGLNLGGRSMGELMNVINKGRKEEFTKEELEALSADPIGPLDKEEEERNNL